MKETDKNTLMVSANNIALEMYSVVNDLPESEKYYSASKLLSSSNDLIFYIAQGLGSDLMPEAGKLDWVYANKALSSIRTMYRFVGKQEFIDIDPDIMVQFNGLAKLISDKQIFASRSAKTQQENEIKHWLNKYEIWKKMQQKGHTK